MSKPFRMFRCVCLFVLLLFFSSLLYGQGARRPSGYMISYNIAEKLYHSVNTTDLTDSLALVSYQQAIKLLTKENIFNAILVDCYLKCGILQMTGNKNEEALINFHQSIAAFQSAEHLPDSFLFKPYLYTGSIHYNLNNLDTAVFYYKKAEAVTNHYAALNESERLYNKLGALYYETGDYKRSIPYYEKALSIITEKKPVDINFIVNYQNNIASSFLKMGSYAQALKIYKSLLKYHINEDQLYTNISLAYLQQGNADTALQFFRRIQQNSIIKYNNLTKAFLAGRQYDSAAYYNKETLDVISKTKSIKNTDYGLALKYAGDINCVAAKVLEGLRNYQSAIIQLLPGFNDTIVTHNPAVFPGLQNFSFLFDVLTSKGNACTLLPGDNAHPQNKQQALAAYNAALLLARHVERTYSSDEARLFLKNKVNTACSQAVTIALELYSQSRDPAYLSKAFSYAENNKASVLQAGLQQLELSGIAGLPRSLIDEEKKYKSLIAKLTIQSAQTRDSISIAAVQKKIQGFELLLSQVQDKLDENPAYHRLKFDSKEISLENIKSQLINKDEAVLSYYYTDKRLLCFYITQEQSGCSSTALNADFFTAIAGLRKELESPGGSSRQFIYDITQKLFQWLLQPVTEKVKGKKHLVIIPYNEICYLPFELLKDPKDGSLLLEKFAISYNYSANFLFDDEAGRDATYKVLAMAPFTEKENVSVILSPLPSSGAEIANLTGKIITGAGATREQFIALSGQFPVIHLATHAVANDKDPLGTYIEFYGEKKDADSLHRLYEKEIYNLDMKSAKLVILSACETGNGMLVNGEGIVSLSRAFSYAGCKSVITSLWKADDAATAFIMKKLHAYLQKGFSKDEALQKAKLDYLNSDQIEERYKTPSYWAHLVLIGNHQPVIVTGTHWYIPVLVMLLLTGIILLYIKRKRAQ